MSISATFAADDNAGAIAVDEITDEPLAVDEDSQALSEGDVVTNDTFYNYFDAYGSLLANVTSTELTFKGEIANVGLDAINIDRPIKITGDNATITNLVIMVDSSDVVISGLTINQDSNKYAISVFNATNVQIEKTTINFEAVADLNGYAIDAELADNLKLIDNTITYVGTTAGTGINNGIRVSESNGATIKGNKFAINLVSSSVTWVEVPTGSGNWVSFPASEGIVIESSKDVTFEGNDVNVEYVNVIGTYDTIYAVSIKSSDNAVISSNNITANGHTYIYGIQISGQDFLITENNIEVTSDNYYANGIDVEGPASGEVDMNTISVTGVQSAYVIYSGMNGANVSVVYANLDLKASAYNVFGFSLGEVKTDIFGVSMDLDGNYTTGIAFYGGSLNLIDDEIILDSSEVGNETFWESFGVEAVGVKVIKGDVSMSDTTIVTPGKGVYLAGANVAADLEGNFIKVVGNDDKDAYAIYVDSIDYGLKIIGNYIIYQGSTKGTGINNAVYMYNVTDVTFSENNFTLDLVSSSVSWVEIPTGSGNWVSFPVSEGIVVDYSTDMIFTKNNIDVTYNGAVGAYDTIYAVDFVDSDFIAIESNNITAKGHTYIYGLRVSGGELIIANNVIKTESDNYYANGIDIEGPADDVLVNSNVISVTGVQSAYAIYSGMNGANVSARYTNNEINGNAYNVFGFSLGDVDSYLYNNVIILDGNYTTGVAFRGGNIDLIDNRIALISSEVGNESVWEGFGVEAVGVKVIKGTVNMTDNTIATPGKGVYLAGANVSADLEGNFINVVGNVDKDAYAIYVDSIDYGLKIIGNYIDYQGLTQGTGINYAVYMYNVTDVTFSENNFTLDLVSSYVPWFEVPTGSGNWVSFPVSEGIVVEDSTDMLFTKNNIDVTYGDVVGTYDTIYAVDFVDSDFIAIESNNITAKGHTYIYGLRVSGGELIIANNVINSESDNYYANGIDIEGPSDDVLVNGNVISVTGVQSAYAIYSGMNGANVSARYTNNEITGNAYNVFGFSLGDVDSYLYGNTVILGGNYTTGVAFRGGNIDIIDNRIVLTSSEIGNETVWEGFGVEAVGVKVIKGDAYIVDNVIATSGKGICLKGDNVSADLEGNFINVVGNDDKDAYAIHVDSIIDLSVVNNEIDYQGLTKGTGINNAVYIVNTTGATVSKNKFTLDLVSCYVPWVEIPTGSKNWVSFPVSEGIVIEESNYATFEENEIELNYGDVCGIYDTIYAVDFKNSDNALIKGNTIDANGHTYIYGLIISGQNFTIYDNDIESESDNYYANGIDVEGPASGVIFGNEIHATGVSSAYPIYSGMNGQNVSVNYINNDIYGNAYLVIGMSLGDVNSTITNNCIYVDGNYTKGIASKVANLAVISNLIVSSGSNVGNESAWEAFGVDTYGIKVTEGDAFIANNTITSTSDYAIYMAPATTGSIANNTLVAKNMGRNAICLDSVIAVSGSGPDYKTIILTSDLTKAYDSATQFVVTVIDENGAPVAGRTVVLTMGVELIDVATTNAKGIARFNAYLPVGSYNVKVSFDGDNTYGPKEATGKIVVTKAATKITASKKTFKVKTKTKKYTVTVKANNKALGKVKVTLKVNGKTFKATTNSKGKATFKITNLKKTGKFTATVKFAGNKSYNASSAKAVITVQ